MEQTRIQKASDIDLHHNDSLMTSLRSIFFETSNRKTFNDDEARERFFQKWCGQYLELFPHYFYVALQGMDLVAYLCGCPDTLAHFDELSIPGTEIFKDLYVNFPAHLHINATEKVRGQGIGAELITKFCVDLKALSVKGVHIITSSEARNVHFYKKMDFVETKERPYKGTPLFFMGRMLEDVF